MLYRISFLGIIAFVLVGCSKPTQTDTLFKLETKSGIDFTNEVNHEAGLDVFRYRNFYNGGGVAIGDVNNDGLADVFLTSNQQSNRLFKNLGNFKFEDITGTSNVGGDKAWSTGVSFADINSDGWLDIYVCNSGDMYGKDRGNELFINNQDGTFTERAAEYGLDDNGYSTHAVFFDFDHDGDLDCYLLNNSFRPVASLPIENIRTERDQAGGDKFLLNVDGKFLNYSDSVGVYGSVIGFGLGITLVDVNQDSWTDIYVSNDFFERDYLYVNQQGKYFTEELEQYFGQISLFSMGADAGDLNNDGLDEVFVTDMLPPDRERLKRTTMFDSYDFYKLKESKGFYKQFMKNTLQLNEGNGNFLEIGRYANTASTDWSWGSLIFDMDNDGYKEIFVANGIYRDVTDQDFIAYLADESTIRETLSDSTVDFEKFIKLMPSNPLSNYAFKLDSLMKYQDMAEEWGLGTPSFSNGAAYGDLDNDGDLDLVVNNVNQPVFVYKNTSEKLGNNYLKVQLKGPKGNSRAIGAQVKVYVSGKIIGQHQYPNRGFQSSMDQTITLGLGKNSRVDSLEIVWDDKIITKTRELQSNKLYTFDYQEGTTSTRAKADRTKEPLFVKTNFRHRHQENYFVDFDRERLLYHQLSNEGPALAVADLNGDGLDDFYIGGSLNYSGALYFNDGQDNYVPQDITGLRRSALHEEVDASFFDADNDGDLDLYIVSGGNELEQGSQYYSDRLLINQGFKDGVLQLELSKGLPTKYEPGSCVRPCDFDKDGDLDLFVGGRSIPGKYGLPPDSYLLQNNGEGIFEDVTSKYITQLSRLGMVTDAVWVDYDQDDDSDLVVVGEWMPITLFENKGNFFQRKLNMPGMDNSEGLYSSVFATDLNGDGFPEIITGNLGQNSIFKADTANPIRLFVGDLDQNNTLDQIYTFKKGESYYPYHVRNELAFQFTFVKKKFPSFEEYADKSMTEIFGAEQLQNSIHLTVTNLSSQVAINEKGKSFQLVNLPFEAQLSPIYEFNELSLYDGQKVILATGNFFATRPEEAIYDANHGVLMTGFPLKTMPKSDLQLRGEVRAVRNLKAKNKNHLLIVKNNDVAEIYAY